MSHRFDAYHTWLGIPRNEQPPNYYRLLGIPLFESNPDVIQNARDQRIMLLNSFAAGPHAALSRRLLSEVARAGACLLKPTEKAAYDAGLRTVSGAGGSSIRELSIPSAPPIVSPMLYPRESVSGPAQPPPRANPDTGTMPSGVLVQSVRLRRQRQEVPATVWIAKALLAAVTGLAAGCFILYLIKPQHPLLVSIAGLFHPGDAKPNEVVKEPPQPIRDTPPELAPESVPDVPVDSVVESQTAPPPDPMSEPPDEVRVPKSDSKTIGVDTTKQATEERISGVTDASNVRVVIQDITGLNMPFRLQPSDGVVSRGNPACVEFAASGGVRICVSLLMRGEDVVLSVAPEIDVPGGKAVEFTQQRVERAHVGLIRDARKLNGQLAAAKSQVAAIDAWLHAPGIKPAQLRDAKAQELSMLRKTVIPGLEQQVKYAASRGAELQMLWQFAKQIHETAKIHYVVQSEPENQSPQ